MRMVTLVGAALAIVLAAQPGQAQPTATPQAHAATAAAVAAAIASAETAVEPATLVYNNREIVQFRSTVLLRTPAERAAAATQFIDWLVESVRSARVSTQPLGEAIAVSLNDAAVFAILPADVNTLAGETLEGTAAAAASALQTAFDEAVELRSPGRLLQAGLLALLATLLYVPLLWLLRRIYRAGLQRVNQTTERQLGKMGSGRRNPPRLAGPGDPAAHGGRGLDASRRSCLRMRGSRSCCGGSPTPGRGESLCAAHSSRRARQWRGASSMPFLTC